MVTRIRAVLQCREEGEEARANQNITATATRLLAGDTSEFSNVEVVAAP
jgi:hypothetical protein